MPVPSVEIQIRPLTREDVVIFQQLIRLFNEVFEEGRTTIRGKVGLQTVLEKSSFIALAAFAGQEVIGGLTAYELPGYYSDSSEIFIYDLAVKAAFQRLGVGKRLLAYLADDCRKKGIAQFFVLAHEEDEHAVRFYQATGGQSEKVVNFVYSVDPPSLPRKNS